MTASVNVYDEGLLRGQADIINFVGTGVTATVSSSTATINVPGLGASGFPFTGSARITGSLFVTGPVTATQAFTGNLQGTSSWATQAISSSFSSTAASVRTAQTASYVLNAVSASFVVSSSFSRNSQTASYVLNAVSASFVASSSFSRNSQTASFALNATSASFASTVGFASNSQTASYALTASFALNSAGGGSTFPFTGSAKITGSLEVTGSFSISGSGYTVLGDTQISGSVDVTGSFTLRSALTLATVGVLPSGQPTGSIMSSGSGANNKPYYWNGANWTPLF